MGHLFRFSYYRRIQVSFILLIMVPVLIISGLLLTMTRETVMDKIRLTNKSFLEVMVKDMTKTIDDLTYASNFFVQDANVRLQLRAFSETSSITSYADYQRQQQLMDFFRLVSAKTLNTDIVMWLVSAKSFIIPSTDISSIDLFREQMKGIQQLYDPERPKELQWLGNVRNDGKEGNSTYYVARVIRDPADDKFLATLYIGMQGVYFEKLFHQVSSGEFALFDNNHQLIAGSSEIRFENTSSSNGEVRSEATLPKTGWKLVYETPQKEVTGQISRMFYIAVFSILPFFALFLILSLVFARRFHLPIFKLQSMAKQYGEGNRTIRFQVRGTDEVSKLGSSVNQMLDRIDELIADISLEQEHKRVLELRALFAQISPHFLMNTLNSIKCSLILTQDKLHSRQIDSLMSLLHSYLRIEEMSTLGTECTLLGNYVDIMKMRNDLQVELVIQLEAGLENFGFPRLLLQPIVENAIIHGFEDQVIDARIVVSAIRLEERVEISIANNGEGVPEDQLNTLSGILNRHDSDGPSPTNRVGLVNVVQRLRLTFGPTSSITMQSNSDGGVTVVINIPHQVETNQILNESMRGGSFYV